MKALRSAVVLAVTLVLGFNPVAQDPEVRTNSIGMQFQLVPAGSFMMGAEGGFDDEVPVHKVNIARSFYLGKHEVTQSQFEKIMGIKPSRFKGDDLPVEQVSWQMATDFCRQLSAIEGVSYRLPTEAEWEYAARGAMEDGKYVWGDHAIPIISEKPQANVADKTAKRLYPDFKTFEDYDDGCAHTSPVGSFPANGFGLHDMAGNVWEWCSDYYGETYYANSPARDPAGPETGTFRVFRGGSWDDGPKSARVTLRGILHDGKPKATNGFRVVMEK